MKQDAIWKEEEINFIKEKVGHQTIESIALQLNRSPHAVRSKLNRLGYTSIRQFNGSMSLNQLAKAVGVSRAVVENWIHRYGLPARKRNYYLKSNKIKHYTIYPDEFWDWAERHKSKINFTKIEPLTILPEPEWFHVERKKDMDKPNKELKNWSEKEDNELKKMLKAGKNYEEISIHLGRSKRSVQSRVYRLRKEGKLPIHT